MAGEEKLLREMYAGFNARAMESVIAMMHEDVLWANGMEGGHVHGRDGVREYWTRQWAMIDPHVDPLSITRAEDGSFVVEVHQVVRDKAGNMLADQRVGHIFRMEDGLVRRFDIRGAEN
jgi:ketosteroid isomerase-like protein